MSNTKKIRALIEEMDSVRKEAQKLIKEISQDRNYSDNYKANQRMKVIEDAKAKLIEINDQAEMIMPKLEAIAGKQKEFSYNDPKLLSAVQFIQLNGAKTPEYAWRQMISDFSENPSELFYLSDIFDSNGVIDGAITAKETAQKYVFSANLPQRIADKFYYMCQSDPTAHVDVSGIVNDLDALEQYEGIVSPENASE